MVGVKNNRRTQYTKKIIKETVLSLLQEQQLDAIKVTQVCKIADINRATFYRYFNDIYDCVDTIEIEFFESLDIPETLSPFESLNKLLEAFYKNPQLSNLVFVEGRTELLDKMHETLSHGHQERTDFDKYQGTYIMLGMQGIMKRWVKNGMEESPAELNKIIWKILFANELREARDEFYPNSKWGK